MGRSLWPNGPTPNSTRLPGFRPSQLPQLTTWGDEWCKNEPGVGGWGRLSDKFCRFPLFLGKLCSLSGLIGVKYECRG
jgi:hypothetical protein